MAAQQAPWVLCDGNAHCEIKVQVFRWLLSHGEPVPYKIYFQSDGASVEWGTQMLAMDAIDVMTHTCAEAWRVRHLATHGHFLADNCMVPLKRRMLGSAKQHAKATLTQREFFSVLRDITRPGYQVISFPLVAAHNYENITSTLTKFRGISKIYKLCVARGINNSAILRTWLRMSDDYFDIVKQTTDAGNAISASCIASELPPLPTEMAPHDEDGIKAALAGHDTIALVIEQRGKFGCVLPKYEHDTEDLSPEEREQRDNSPEAIAYFAKLLKENEEDRQLVPKTVTELPAGFDPIMTYW